MAPSTRKRKSDEMEDASSQPATPTAGSRHKKLKVTEAQKQALIDNLQLEIDERKRRLRAHYALQCADLRSRIERRINRIPIAMRKMTMAEVMAKHEASVKAQQKPIVSKTAASAVSNGPLPQLPQQEMAKYAQPNRTHAHSPVTAAAAPQRGRKRKTSEIHIVSDGDVENQAEVDSLPVAKKTRGKAGAVAAPSTATTTTTAGAVSHTQKGAASVLSPRSHNSRTLSRPPPPLTKGWNSPAKLSSPMKSAIARPISPIKPASPLKSAAFAISAAAHGMARGAAATASRLGGGRTASKEKKMLTASPTSAKVVGKMLPPPRPVTAAVAKSPIRQPSAYTTTSEKSTASSGTTIVKSRRGGRSAAATATTTTGGVGKAAAAKKTTATTTSAARTAKPTATTATNKKVVVAEPAAGRRILRKRN